jgi:5-methylthioadenosine/S-adenosylhomocysteine deaminase
VEQLSELIRCARAVVAGRERKDYAFVVTDGWISDAGEFSELKRRHAQAAVRSFAEDRLVVPGFVNGHSHAYQIVLRGWADDLPFARWRDEALYRVVPALSPQDVYWIFVAAFDEMLAAGITAVAEFFYLNGAGNEFAESAIAAARDTGIRLVLARAWMDAPSAPPAFRETIEQAQERTRELRARHPSEAICVAPHSLHGASEPMMRAAAEFAASERCDLHVHVAEAPYEVEMSLQRYGVTPILALDRFGALSERTVAVHCICVSDEEKRLLAQRGVRVVHNPTTNLYLGDGITDVVGLRRLGVALGLGTDADVKSSLLDEMRAAAYLQKLERRDGGALSGQDVWGMGTSAGASVIGIAAGELEAGRAADFIVLDARRIDPWSPAVNALVYRGSDDWVRSAYVGGRLARSDEPSQLAGQARQKVASIAARLVP